MIKNKSKNTVIAKSYSPKTGLGRAKGLLFESKPEAIFFKTRFGIHTFFLKFPIDLIVLDSNKKVKFLRESIKPNRIALWNPKYNLILELPQGSIKDSDTSLGDIIIF